MYTVHENMKKAKKNSRVIKSFRNHENESINNKIVQTPLLEDIEVVIQKHRKECKKVRAVL